MSQIVINALSYTMRLPFSRLFVGYQGTFLALVVRVAGTGFFGVVGLAGVVGGVAESLGVGVGVGVAVGVAPGEGLDSSAPLVTKDGDATTASIKARAESTTTTSRLGPTFPVTAGHLLSTLRRLPRSPTWRPPNVNSNLRLDGDPS